MNLRVDPKDADSDFVAALAREAGVAVQESAASPAAGKAHIPFAPLAPGAIEIGRNEFGAPIGIDLDLLIDGRLLIQGVSGAGKSWTLRRLIEQTARRIQQIVIDPEGEFSTLGEGYGLTRIDAEGLDEHALRLAAERAREHRLSILLDLSNVDPERLLQSATAFLRGLVEVPRAFWSTALVIIDEAHLFAPSGTAAAAVAPSLRKASIGAMADIVARGRKRGLCAVLATQRIAQLAGAVKAPIVNSLTGQVTLDIDIRRAAETIGWNARRAFDRLPELETGHFVAVGRAFSQQPAVVKIGAVETEHRGARPAIVAPTDRNAAEVESLLDVGTLLETSAKDEASRGHASSRPDGYARVRAFIREPQFAAAGAIVEALRPISPNGAKIDTLPKALKRKPEAIHEALAILDRYCALEFAGDGENRIVRLARDFRPGAQT